MERPRDLELAKLRMHFYKKTLSIYPSLAILVVLNTGRWPCSRASCNPLAVTFQVDNEDNPDCMTNAALCAWTIRSLKSRCCLPRTPCSRAWRQKFLGDGRSHCSGTFEREMDQVTERLAVHTHVTRSINVFLQRIESAFGLRFIRLSVRAPDCPSVNRTKTNRCCNRST